jgi:hypothetical protein
VRRRSVSSGSASNSVVKRRIERSWRRARIGQPFAVSKGIREIHAGKMRFGWLARTALFFCPKRQSDRTARVVGYFESKLVRLIKFGIRRDWWDYWGLDARNGGMNLILGTGYALIGLALTCWAAPLSVRYNAWTTGLRERHPNINPPPTPEWRARNTKIMTVMFRVLGVFLVLLSIMYLLPLIVTKPH